jgi:hypothetical protein
LIEPTQYFTKKGWSELAARGIATYLGGDTPQMIVPPKRWGLYRDWASAHERNADYVSTAWAFVDFELRNAFHGIGRAEQSYDRHRSARCCA